jgi:ferredoxin
MPKLIINDEEYECRPNERLLSVARRNGAHIGFMCMGRGYCHTCACRILSGAEHLSPPTELEENWFKTSELRSNHRLACQTFMHGSGPVEILSRAEELRRQATNVLDPPEGSSSLESLSDLLGSIGSIAAHLPADALGVATHIGKKKLAPRLQDDVAPKIKANAGPNTKSVWKGLDRTTKKYTPNLKIIRRVLNDTNKMAQRMIGNPNGSPIGGMPMQYNEDDEIPHAPSHATVESMRESQTPAEQEPATPQDMRTPATQLQSVPIGGEEEQREQTSANEQQQSTRSSSQAKTSSSQQQSAEAASSQQQSAESASSQQQPAESASSQQQPAESASSQQKTSAQKKPKKVKISPAKK